MLNCGGKCLLTLLLIVLLSLTSAILATPSRISSNRFQTEQSRKVVTPELLLADFSYERSLPAVQWLPDGSHILLALKERSKEGLISWIELVDVKSGERVRLGQGSDPVPSPAGEQLAFLAQKEGETQLWIRSLSGNQTRQVTAVPGGLGAGYYTSFSWSLDSKEIAFAYRPVEKPEKSDDSKSVSSVVVIGGEGDIPPESQVWMVDVESGVANQVTTGPYRVASLSWFPDGQALLCAVHGSFEYKRDDVFGEVRRIDISSGNSKILIKDSGVQVLKPAMSPNGRIIAFLYDPANQVYPFHTSIAIAPSEGGEIRQLTQGQMVESKPIWSPDSMYIYYVGRVGVFRQLFSVTIRGEVQKLTEGKENVTAPALSPDGRTLIWSTEDLFGQKKIYFSNIDGSCKRVLIELVPEIKQLMLGDISVVNWKSRDGLELSGFIVFPNNYDSRHKYPLLVDLHGGPVGGVRPVGSILLRTPLEWHMWAAKGFAVFVPEYRSSVTYGWDEILKTREKQDADYKDYEDIMSGIDYITSVYFLDPDRLVLIGHSNGAILANWIITKTDRFKVAVSYEGKSEKYMEWGSGVFVGGSSIYEWLLKGKPWEAKENYLNAAAYYVKNVRTPTLFISGEKGIPLYHNQFLYSALKKLGVDTELLVYGGEGHVVQRKENLQDLLGRVLNWIQEHLEDT